jgi:hypothetical protein
MGNRIRPEENWRRMSSTEAHSERYARSFRESADSAKQNGDNNRAVRLYEHALNFTIDVLNEALAESPQDIARIHRLIDQAIECAEACGRTRKAEHLRKDLAKLLDPTSPKRR